MSTKQVVGGKLVANGNQVPVSKGIVTDDFVFVSGQLAFAEGGIVMDGDITAQTHRALELLEGILQEAGCTMNDIVKCTCWIKNEEDFGAFNIAYAEHFGEEPPARSCLISNLLLGALVEIEAIAKK